MSACVYLAIEMYIIITTSEYVDKQFAWYLNSKITSIDSRILWYGAILGNVIIVRYWI